MTNKLKLWWNKERINRTEKDTSQDMFSTNGLLATYWIIMLSIIGLIIITAIYL